MGDGVEVWRGSVADWECDSMGHLNVGFYAAKVMEALAGLAAELGMPAAFTPHAAATLLLREQHIRFLREARIGAQLHIDAGVLEMGEDEARVLLLMRHGDGELAASFQMRLAHVTAREGRPFPWPGWARERAARLTIEFPEKARPRSLSLEPVESGASLARAEALGLQRIGLGAIRPAECDAFGRMAAETVIARISGSVAHLMADRLAAISGERIGAVMLEYRLLYLAWPRSGERLEIRSGLSGAEPRLLRLTHWLLDPATGRPWASAQGVAAVFDARARKLVALSEAELAAWIATAVPELTL